MKKFFAIALVSLMLMSLAACGNTSSTATGSAATGSAASGSAAAESFVPKKSITWICTSSAGGGSDIFTRKISEIMTNENLVNGQTIIVSNETDGSGEVGRNKVATMTNDADTTLLTFNSGDLTPMVQNTKNRAANFRILAIMAVDKQLMFSCPASDSKTDYAKSGGDRTDFAAAIKAAKNGTFVVIGGSKGDDIATYKKLLKEIGLTEKQMGYITYDATSDAITAALGGNVDFVISKPAAASQYVESGDLKPVLALSNERYSGNLADAPTLSEIGNYQNVEVPVWRGVAAPAAMSDAAVAYWSNVLDQVSKTKAWKDEYLATYQLIDQHMSTAEATKYVSDYQSAFMAENGLS